MANNKICTQKEQDHIAEKISSLKLFVNKRTDDNLSAKLYAFPAYIKNKKLPGQGFKIHISATFLNANEVFDSVIPYLLEQNIAFKVVSSNKLLRLLNEDRFGYMQVGKFITIYPNSIPHFVNLIYQLDKKLINFEAPIIPSDLRLHEKSIVYYRYGVITNPDNKLILPNGSTVEDTRNPHTPVPSWIINPLRSNSTLQQLSPTKLLLGQYIILKALRQRAKGLVALIVDIKGTNRSRPKMFILKEARKLGALNEKGVDAMERLEKEFFSYARSCKIRHMY